MRLHCQHCGKHIESDGDIEVGRRVQCPYCGHKFAYGGDEAPPVPPRPSPAPAPAPAAPRRPAGAPARPSSAPSAPPTLAPLAPKRGKGVFVVLALLVAAGVAVWFGRAKLASSDRGAAMLNKICDMADVLVGTTTPSSPGIGADASAEKTASAPASAFARARAAVRGAVLAVGANGTAARDDKDVAPAEGTDVCWAFLGHGGRLELCVVTPDAAPNGRLLIDRRLPTTLAADALQRRVASDGAFRIANGVACFVPPTKTESWSVPDPDGDAFDPAVKLFGKLYPLVADLGLSTDGLAFDVGLRLRLPQGSAPASDAATVRPVHEAAVARVGYGLSLEAEKFTGTLTELVKAVARKRVVEVLPLDPKRQVTVQVYEGRQVVYNEATKRWLLPRYRANAVDKAKWDEINARLAREQDGFTEYRREIRAKRREWFLTHTSPAEIGLARKFAEVVVSPAPRETVSPVAAQPQGDDESAPARNAAVARDDATVTPTGNATEDDNDTYLDEIPE